MLIQMITEGFKPVTVKSIQCIDVAAGQGLTLKTNIQSDINSRINEK